MLPCGRFYGRHACDIWVLCREGGGRLLVLGIFSDMLKRRRYIHWVPVRPIPRQRTSTGAVLALILDKNGILCQIRGLM